MADIALNSAVRSNLRSLQSTTALMSRTEERLSSGKKVNSALDNPSNFFTAQALDRRSSDLSNLLDSVSNSVQTLKAADNGISAISDLVNQMKSTARSAQQSSSAVATQASFTSSALTGLTSDNLLATTTTPGSKASVTAAGAYAAPSAGNGQPAVNTAATAYTDLNFGAAGAAVNTGTAFTALDLSTSGDKVDFTIGDGTNTTAISITSAADTSSDGTVDATEFAAAVNAQIAADTTNPAAITAGVNGAGRLTFTSTATGTAATAAITAFSSTATGGASGLANTSVNGTAAGSVSFNVSDGTNSTSVTLNSSTTGAAGGLTGQEAADAINAAILADTTNPAGVTASFANGELVFTSTASGSSAQANVASFASTGNITSGSAGLANNSANGSGTAGSPYAFTLVDETSATPTNLTIAPGATLSAAITSLNTQLGNASRNVEAFDDNGKLGLRSVATTAATSITVGGADAATVFGSNTADTGTADVSTTGLSGKTLTVSVAGASATTVTFGTNAGEVDTLDELNEALSAAGAKASLSTAGALTVSTSNSDQAQSLTIGGSLVDTASTTAANGEIFDLASTAAASKNAVLDQTNRAQRINYKNDYNDLREQIVQLAKDASYNGVNLLSGDDLKVVFNEDGSSSLDIAGVDLLSTLGLDDMATEDFLDAGKLDAVVDTLNKALTNLDSLSSKFGSKLSVVQTRQDFTKEMIGTLDDGSNNLTAADTNEEAANLATLQTRQSLIVSSLSISTSQEQNVLQLLR